jgi:hypothetical protein
LHNWEIEKKDLLTQGGLRRAIRLLKSLRFDNELKISSYNIYGIAFNIPNEDLSFAPPYELSIVHSCLNYCKLLEQNQYERNSISVPNGTRKVFDSTQGATLSELQALTRELQNLQNDILLENSRSFKKLADARIANPIRLKS